MGAADNGVSLVLATMGLVAGVGAWSGNRLGSKAEPSPVGPFSGYGHSETLIGSIDGRWFLWRARQRKGSQVFWAITERDGTLLGPNDESLWEIVGGGSFSRKTDAMVAWKKLQQRQGSAARNNETIAISVDDDLWRDLDEFVMQQRGAYPGMGPGKRYGRSGVAVDLIESGLASPEMERALRLSRAVNPELRAYRRSVSKRYKTKTISMPSVLARKLDGAARDLGSDRSRLISALIRQGLRGAQRQGSASASSWDELWLSRGQLHTPDGAVPMKRIGKGMFARAYRDRSDPSKVWLFVDDRAHEKEILWMLRDEAEDNPHLPKIERMGFTEDETVYRMPFYHKLTKARAPEAWREYMEIKRCLDEQVSHGRNLFQGYERTYAAVQCLKDGPTPSWPSSLVTARVSELTLEALESLRDTAADYGSNYWMEISPRNLAVDDDGNLVLLDILFDAKLVRNIRQQEAKKARRKSWGGW